MLSGLRPLQDAVRNTRVITNTFDVGRGQFSGALVAWRGGNVLLTLLAGMATFWALRWLGM